jgi:hypothetical protein
VAVGGLGGDLGEELPGVPQPEGVAVVDVDVLILDREPKALDGEVGVRG